MTRYSKSFSRRTTPQSERADPRQVQNSAGGYTFEVTPWQRLDRWLILGADGGSYYAGERSLTRENATVVDECLRLDGARAVARIVEISEAGRAPKNAPAIFALALAASADDAATRRAALDALPRVCRTGTHLFEFAESVQAMRGWGRGLRRAVARWYDEKRPNELCYQLTKYGQRNGWSHRDLLRLAHPEATETHAPIYRWAIGADTGERKVGRNRVREYPAAGPLPGYLAAFDELKLADEKRTIELIREHGFTHEMIATERKNSAAVWEALLERMPMTALVRNLAKMTEVGLLKPLSAAARLVSEHLGDQERIRKSRIHPIQLLSAFRVYAQGHGERGKLRWTPVPQLIDALDAAFYLAFGNIEPSGKRTLIALDVSGSMGWGSIAGVPGLTPRLAAAAMAMVTMRTEPEWHVVGFSHRLVPLPITPNQRLDDVVRTMEDIPFGGTDCAEPMLYADRESLEVDAFQVWTDNETWYGSTHPHQALRAYREKSGISATLAVIGCVANNFTIADPSDPRQLDVVGFDSATPNVLASFARGWQ